MPRTVLDSASLISAFLKPGGVADLVLQQAYERAFELFLAEEILAETQRVLIEADRIRQSYIYPDESVHRFIRNLRGIAQMIGSLPSLTGIVRDPNDDMIVACALAAEAQYIVTRDLDLLSLGTYETVTMITPEAFMGILRH